MFLFQKLIFIVRQIDTSKRDDGTNEIIGRNEMETRTSYLRTFNLLAHNGLNRTFYEKV